MKRALKLAAIASGRTSPNPMVGAVIAKKGRIIAEGYHKKAGLPHAEAEALSHATESTRGATLYVTLEPCCHTDKRTPPCTEAIIASGIKSVVIAMEDPNPKVNGRGRDILIKAGIAVRTGVLEKEARHLNEFYIKYARTGLPFVLLKTAMTLDGKIATPRGESQWISSERSRRYVHRLRGTVDAVLSAIGTVKADDPRFTARSRGCRDPLRIVIDPKLETPDGSQVLQAPPPTILVTCSSSSRARVLRERGIEVLQVERPLRLRELLKVLASRGVMSIMIEGGASLAAHALDEQIVDKIAYFIAPKIIGGENSPTPVGGKTFLNLDRAIKVTDMTFRRSGPDVLVEGYLDYA